MGSEMCIRDRVRCWWRRAQRRREVRKQRRPFVHQYVPGDPSPVATHSPRAVPRQLLEARPHPTHTGGGTVPLRWSPNPRARARVTTPVHAAPAATDPASVPATRGPRLVGTSARLPKNTVNNAPAARRDVTITKVFAPFSAASLAASSSDQHVPFRRLFGELDDNRVP